MEGFLDPGDSVKRRKTADRVYKELVAERISSERAAEKLKELTQRQKGGWLLQAFESLRGLSSKPARIMLPPVGH